MQHHKELKDVSIEDILMWCQGNGGEPNMTSNLHTLANTGHAALLDELLKAGIDPDIVDSRGRTPLVKLQTESVPLDVSTPGNFFVY